MLLREQGKTAGEMCAARVLRGRFPILGKAGSQWNRLPAADLSRDRNYSMTRRRSTGRPVDGTNR